MGITLGVKGHFRHKILFSLKFGQFLRGKSDLDDGFPHQNGNFVTSCDIISPKI